MLAIPSDFSKNLYYVVFIVIERNGLSFIETSALDSTNVETAFHNILTGRFIYIYLPLVLFISDCSASSLGCDCSIQVDILTF